MFKLNYKPSGANVKATSFGDKIANFVKVSVDDQYLIPEFTPVSDQGSLGSCCPNAVCDSLEILKGLEDSTNVVQVSRLFLYYNVRAHENDIKSDNGCYIHNALASLVSLGVCREQTWQYDENQVFVHPPLEAYKEGSDNQITTFYQITSTGNDRLRDIETAVRSNHPVIFGTTVGQELLDYKGENKVLGIPNDNIGGHAMLIVGVRTNADNSRSFRIRNSWNKNWGDNGHVWFSADYITWSQTNDLFVPTRMTDFLI